MKNFTISLYTYHLAQTLDDDFDDTLNQVNNDGAALFGQELKTKLTEQINLNFELTTLLLHDTYFADLTFCDPDSKIDFLPAQMEQFIPLLPQILPQILPENSIEQKNDAEKIIPLMGTTILIYGELPCKLEANQNLANEYVRAFLKKTLYKNDKITSSEQKDLLGIPLFEYFCGPTKSNNSDHAQESICHILVLLNYQGENSGQKLDVYYKAVVDLLCSYHKINFVCQQAKLNYQAARQVAQKIEQEIDDFGQYIANKNKNLNEFSAMLDRLPLLALEHSTYCGKLELSVNTIEINHQLYQSYLEELVKAGSQLDSWQEFSNQTTNISLKQIRFWLHYMNPPKELAQQLTASIRGIVEIEQAESDRQRQEAEKDRDQQLQERLRNNAIAEKKRDQKLQNTIQSVGVGVGVGVGIGGIIATSYPLIEKPWHFPSIQNPQFTPHPFVVAIISSFLLGGGLGLLTWQVTRKRLEALLVNKQELKSSEENKQ